MSEGSGDFKAYSAVNLHIGAVNNHIISETPSIVYENANKGYGGMVFSISVWTKEDWSKNGPAAVEVGYMKKIGENGDKVFTISSPGDVNYDLHDQNLTAEYMSMSGHINTIRTTFRLKN